MKTLFFDAEISKETIPPFIEELEDACSEDKEATVYFTSSGGFKNYADIFADYVNNKTDINIHFILTWEVHSAAFDMMCRIKSKKTVMDGTYAIVHLYGRELHTRNDRELYDFLVKGMNKGNDKMLSRFKNFLKDDEIEKIKNQEDIYLTDERLRLILS